MIRGMQDGNSNAEDRIDFFQRLPSGDRQFAVSPYTAHSAGNSNHRHLPWCAALTFLGAPTSAG